MSYELISRDRAGKLLGEPHPIEDEAGAVAAYFCACRHAEEHEGAFELLKDGVVILSYSRWPQEGKRSQP